MRIAVLLSGQVRDWMVCRDNQKFFWTSCTQKDPQVDYFIHTWDYSQDRTGVTKPYQNRNISEQEFKEILDFYQPKKYIIESKPSKDVFYDDHWCNLFYSFVKSLQFKREYELENNFKYDVVVKSRFDLAFDPRYHFRIPVLFNNCLYTTHGGPMEMECGMFNFNDCVFLGNSYSMDLLINIYHYRQFLIRTFELKDSLTDNRNRPGHPYGPGTLMHEYFRDYGITPMFNMGWQETIIKAGHPEGLNLFKPEEFDIMEKYFRDWYLN